jgi:uncharacterized damage-inducible protein DinB
MSDSALGDAFAHHVWATLTLADVCLELSGEQLASSVPGTYGTIFDTMRHLVGSDASYLFVTSKGEVERVDEEAMNLAELRAEMERHGPAWANVIADADPDEVLVRYRDDGSAIRAPVSIRLAQALHHGTDHRSQICTALTALGIEPPFIDVWDYGEQVGMVLEDPATS